jgi:predicted amidophosphoribosyltransferase
MKYQLCKQCNEDTDHIAGCCIHCGFEADTSYKDNPHNNSEAEKGTTDDREAKRIACIAESMNIIRTLNSHKILFDVRFGLATILFEIADQDLKAFNIYFKHESATVTVRHDNGLWAILLTW